MFGKILTFVAKAAVQEIIGQIMQQIDIVQDQVESPLRSLAQPIMDGAWTGEGADAFLDEMETRVIPEILDIIEAATNFGGSVGGALDIFDEVDDAVGGIVDSTVDFFDSIF